MTNKNKSSKLDSNVIGPIAPEDWLTMLMFRQSLKFLQEKKADKGREIAIRKEKAILQKFYDKYCNKEAA